MQLHLFNQRDQFTAQLFVILLTTRCQFLARGKSLHALGTEFRKFAVNRFNLFKSGQHFRLQLFFERGQRKAKAFPFLTFFEFFHRRRNGGFRIAGGLRCFQVNNIAQQHARRGLAHRFMPAQNGLEGQRAFAKPANHHVAPGFNALGDGNFAFTRKQLNAAHFAQIHANGIIGAPDAFLIHIAAGFFFLTIPACDGLDQRAFAFFGFFSFRYRNAGFAQHRHGIFDHFRRYLF